MGFMDKAIAGAQQAANKAKEGVEDVAAKRDLQQAYTDLGRLTYSLASQGELTHPQLSHLIQRISEMESPVA